MPRVLAVALHIGTTDRPQVDARLTTPIELRARCSRSPPFRRDENRSGRCSRTAALSTACKVELRTPLSPLVAPRSGRAGSSTPRPLCPTPSSKESEPTRPRMTSSRRVPARPPLARRIVPMLLLHPASAPLRLRRRGCRGAASSCLSPLPFTVAVLQTSRPATGPAVLPPRSSFRRFFAHRCSRTV